jgi:hypothetical protein
MLWKIYLSIYLSICLSVCLSVCLWFYSPLFGIGQFLSFLILYTVLRTLRTGDQPVARPLPTYKTTQTKNKPHRYKCLVWESNRRSQCSSERRQFMPWPRGHCDYNNNNNNNNNNLFIYKWNSTTRNNNNNYYYYYYLFIYVLNSTTRNKFINTSRT